MIDLIQWAKHRYPTIMDMRTIKGGGICCLIVLWQNYPIIMHMGTICRDWHASSDCFIIKYKWNWLSASIWHIMFTKLNMSISLYESRESLGSQNWSHLWPWPLKTKEVSILLYNPTGWQGKEVFHQPDRENQQISSANTMSKMNCTSSLGMLGWSTKSWWRAPKSLALGFKVSVESAETTDDLRRYLEK